MCCIFIDLYSHSQCLTVFREHMKKVKGKKKGPASYSLTLALKQTITTKKRAYMDIYSLVAESIVMKNTLFLMAA